MNQQVTGSVKVGGCGGIVETGHFSRKLGVFRNHREHVIQKLVIAGARSHFELSSFVKKKIGKNEISHAKGLCGVPRFESFERSEPLIVLTLVRLLHHQEIFS